MNAPRPWVETFLRRFEALDKALVAAGFPATSPWWFSEIRRFMRAGRRRWVIRAGRRAGKSSTLARLAVAWALYGPWSVTPGDAAVIPFVSIKKDEAAARIRNISAILTALGVKFDQRSEELEFKNKTGATVLFKVVACDVSAVGFTSIAVFGDEVARWESRDTGANPAREVIGSLAPTMATQPFAFLVISASPWSLDDFHAESYDLGETAHQCVSYAPTWIANPTLTEEETHGLEPDPRVWAREYKAEPSHSVAAALDADEVLACFGRQPRGIPLSQGWVALDPSSLVGKDGFGFAIGTTTEADEVIVQGAGELENMTLKQIAKAMANAARMVNTNVIYSDKYEAAGLTSYLSEESIELRVFPWSESSKDEAFVTLRRWLKERRLVVTADELDGGSRLRKEFLAIKARLLPSGRIQYSTNGLDTVSPIVTLATAANKGDFSFQSRNPLFDALERIAREEGRLTIGGRTIELTRGPGTTRSALPAPGIDRDFMNMLARHQQGSG